MRIRPTAALAALLLTMGVGAAAANDNDQVCGPLDSGKVDTTGDPATVDITAPDGFLIGGYCVKAGSAKQGDGPVYVTLPEPLASITVGHPSGKDVSHWSASYVPVPVEPEPEPEPQPEPETPQVQPEPTTTHTVNPTPPAPPVVHHKAVPQGVGSPEWQAANPGVVVEFG